MNREGKDVKKTEVEGKENKATRIIYLAARDSPSILFPNGRALPEWPRDFPNGRALPEWPRDFPNGRALPEWPRDFPNGRVISRMAAAIRHTCRIDPPPTFFSLSFSPLSTTGEHSLRDSLQPLRVNDRYVWLDSKLLPFRYGLLCVKERMFNPQQQRAPPGSMQPPAAMQQQSQCEIQAKEKLITIVYEYLLYSGAQKAADAFKEEVLNNHPNTSVSGFQPKEMAPGFLHNWFMIFWDLYQAASDRRECEPSQDGKMFYEIFMQGGGYGPGGPMGMNGMPGMFPPGMPGMPGPDGMMGGFPGRFPGRGGPTAGMPPGYAMFPPGADPRMAGQRMPPNAMRGMPPGASFPPGAMRPGTQTMGFRPGPYMDSPSQAFPPGAMMPNGMGTPGAMSMSSPGLSLNPEGHPSFLPGGMPTSSSAMPFSMGDTTVSMGSSSGMPSTGLPESQQLMPLNGDDIKQSPASTPRGVNGGTPAPGSAQSGQPSSGTPGQSVPADEKPGSNSKMEADEEINKIKSSMFDDFTPLPKEEAGSDPAFFS